MLKRTLALILGLLILAGTALADLPDFASMSFEDLNTMKQALDKEYFARPEAEGLTLGAGIYTAGVDFKPGTYYLGIVEPYTYGGEVSVQIKKGDAMPVRVGVLLGDVPLQTILNDGDSIYIETDQIYLSAREYDPEEFYKYKVPDGTFIPEGVYFVGEDIPAGRYSVSPGGIPAGRYEVFVPESKENGETRYVYKSGDAYRKTIWVTTDTKTVTIDLDDGDKIEVKRPIVMKKTEKTKLIFD